MDQMGIALAALHFGARHAETAVGILGDVLLGDGSPEAGPAGARLELGIGAEQCIVAADTAVETLVVQLVIFAGEGRLSPFFAGNRELLGGELVLPFFVAFDYFFNAHSPY